jgi:penicillin-insensitive murein DD-endopeptidase
MCRTARRTPIHAARGMFRGLALTTATLGSLALAGCTRTPTPLHPGRTGSIGLPASGVLRNGHELPNQGIGYARLRRNPRNYGTPHVVQSVQHALKFMALQRPGSATKVGDISAAEGGQLLPHFSHRSGRDVDILPYYQTLEGVPVPSPNFLAVGTDGLAFDGNRYLRLDVEREWLLIRELAEPRYRVQWIFIHHNQRLLLLEWATARGESAEVVARVADLMHEPNPGGLHDDHIHVRFACSREELSQGCEWSGPKRSWHLEDPSPSGPTDHELVRQLMVPLGSSDAVPEAAHDRSPFPVNEPTTNATTNGAEQELEELGFKPSRNLSRVKRSTRRREFP